KGWGMRATLNWEPTHLPMMFSLVADHAEFEDNGAPYAVLNINRNLRPLVGLVPLGGAAYGQSIGELFAANGLNPDDYVYRKGHNYDEVYGDPRTGISRVDKPYDTGEQQGVSGTLDVDIGSVHLKSISAWRTNKATNAQDLDSTPIRLLAFGSIYDQEQLSQELQLSTTIGKLDVIGGAFWFKEDGTERSVSDSFGAFPLLALGPVTVFTPGSLNFSDFESESKALFAQANYHITEKLRATVGYRYTWDDRGIGKRGLTGSALNPDGSIISMSPAVPYSDSFQYPAWTLGVDYQATEDLFLYAKTGRASMAGGFNTRPAPPGLESFDPEELTDVEVGM